MSSAEVRAAITTYLNGARITGLTKVFRAQPWYIDGSQWNLADNLGSGAVGFVHLASDTEERITLPAPNTLGGPVGNKAVRYDVGLVVLYQFLLPSGTLVDVAEDEWALPLDATIDAVKDAVRADPNLGAPGVIFQAGQDIDGIKIVRDLPRRAPGKVLAWNVLEFKVLEIIVD